MVDLNEHSLLRIKNRGSHLIKINPVLIQIRYNNSLWSQSNINTGLFLLMQWNCKSFFLKSQKLLIEQLLSSSVKDSLFITLDSCSFNFNGGLWNKQQAVSVIFFFITFKISLLFSPFTHKQTFVFSDVIICDLMDFSEYRFNPLKTRLMLQHMVSHRPLIRVYSGLVLQRVKEEISILQKMMLSAAAEKLQIDLCTCALVRKSLFFTTGFACKIKDYRGLNIFVCSHVVLACFLSLFFQVAKFTNVQQLWST